MIDYETFIKTNFTDQVTVKNPDIHIIHNTKALHPDEFSFLVNDFPKPETMPEASTPPPHVEKQPIIQDDTEYIKKQKDRALADYALNVRKLTLSLEKQKARYKEHSQQLKHQSDQQLQALNQQSNNVRIELRQRIIDQRSEHSRQLESYDKEFLSDKAALLRRHTEELASINKQFHQDFLLKETESKQQLQALETEYNLKIQGFQDKIKELQQHFDGERQKVRQQYEPIIQSEQAHFQKMLHDVKEKRDQLISNYESQRQQLREHYEPLIQADKDRYRHLLTTIIHEKETLVKELNALSTPNN